MLDEFYFLIKIWKRKNTIYFLFVLFVESNDFQVRKSVKVSDCVCVAV